MLDLVVLDIRLSEIVITIRDNMLLDHVCCVASVLKALRLSRVACGTMTWQRLLEVGRYPQGRQGTGPCPTA